MIQAAEFELGPVRVHPAARAIESDKGFFLVEPLVMQLLVELSRRAGRVVTRREIFERCWGGAAVGDDSLNRIVRALRKALDSADGETLQIDTVPGTGYSLRLRMPRIPDNSLRQAVVEQAIRQGTDSVRAGRPEPDHLSLELLARAVRMDPGNPDAWGMRALLSRYAAEYAEPRDVPAFVAECQASARRAFDLDESQPFASVAVATVAPIFGRWLEARSALTSILEAHPATFFAEHEMVICDMSTGRVLSAHERTAQLIDGDPLAACLIYKGIYQNWSIGNLHKMDQLAEKGVHLWPTHPAIWMARLWTLAFTGRLEGAQAMILDRIAGPAIPDPMLRLMGQIIGSALSGSRAEQDSAAAAILRAAADGPVRAVTALFALGLLKRVDDAFAVADAYYLRQGAGPVPHYTTSGEAPINDLHRRVTQILFTPACADMRRDARFMPMCARIGLVSYWEQTGLTPDFLEEDDRFADS